MTFDELVLMVGQKGGKNYLVETIVGYYCKKLNNLVNPHKYFNIDQLVEFNICNSSLVNERQAKNVFFERVKNIIKRTIDPKTGDNWFERYVGLDLRPKGFGDMQSKTIVFPSPEGRGKIKFHSFDSTPESPEGLEIFFGIMDEPSRANTPLLYEKAVKLYKMYRGNIAGSFPSGLGKLAIFSYPEQKINDLTVERYEKAVNEDTTFRLKATTYEFNPHRTKEMNKKAYQDDPIDSLCRFECVIPESRFGFFAPYFDKIDECINPDLVNRIKFRPSITRMNIKQGKGTVVRELTGTEILSIEGDNRLRVWAGDLGKTHDNFIIASGYPEYYDEETDDVKTIEIRKRNDETGDEIVETYELKGKVVVDTIVVWRPTIKRPVNFLDVDYVLTSLLQKFTNSNSVHFDQWNSASLQQKVLQMGIECETHHFSNKEQVKMYTILRGLIWNNMFEYLPRSQYCFGPKEVDVQKELKELLFINKNKIDHPDNGGSKDIADVFALLAKYVLLAEAKPEMKILPDMKYDLDEYARRYKAVLQLLQKEFNGKMPEPEEIAKEMEIPVDWVQEIRDYIDDPMYNLSDLSGIMPEGSL